MSKFAVLKINFHFYICPSLTDLLFLPGGGSRGRGDSIKPIMPASGLELNSE